jgi:hypothetical protein
MELALSDLLIVGPILFAASMLQAVVGFAAGLFGIPLLLLVGLSLPQAIAMSLMATLFQSTWGAYRLRYQIDFPSTILPCALRIAGLPIGLFILWMTESLDHGQIKQLIGGVLLVVVLVQWLWRVEPREKLHAGWTWMAFSLSGILVGFVGIGGPPMVLWVMAHQWTSARSRGFMFVMFAVGASVQLILMAAMYGGEVISAMGLGLLAVAFTLAGASVGMRLGNRVSKPLLRQISFILLVLIAATTIVAPLIMPEQAAAAKTSAAESG